MIFIYKRIIQNEFFKNVVTLFSGTVIAQLIPLLISPVLTRLYNPSEFGILALYISLSAMISVIATGRYEFSIVQARDTNKAFDAVMLCFTLSAIISTISFFGLLIIYQTEIGSAYLDGLSVWFYFIPLSIFFIGIFQTLNYWCSRERNYKDIAASKVIQSIVNVVLCLSLFMIDTAPALGLIIAHLVSQIISSLVLLYRSRTSLISFGFSFDRIYQYAKSYYRFPKYSAPGALFNSVALQLPIVFVSKVYDMSFAGYFNFVYRIVGGPLALLSTAISQVFFQRVSSVNGSSLYNALVKAAMSLLLMSILPVTIVFLFGEVIFSFVFGEEWSVAGEMAEILIFSIGIRFIVSPLSMVIAIDRFVKYGFVWQFVTFILISVFLFFAAEQEISAMVFVKTYVVVDVLLYSFYLVLLFIMAKKV
ncbi:oligosaccharide flippase family protein [Shewanella indica]|uniref:oligosaccharide flippase family protein n=1 Tax=Shewanella indica TaxID=768528 RepID=UPI00313E38B6